MGNMIIDQIVGYPILHTVILSKNDDGTEGQNGCSDMIEAAARVKETCTPSHS